MNVLKNDKPASVISILRRADGTLVLYIGNFGKQKEKITVDFDGIFSNTYIHAFDHVKKSPFTFYVDKNGKAAFEVEDYILISAYKEGA